MMMVRAGSAVDERCVPAEDYESNYGTMRRLLLDEVGMPDE